MSKKNAINNASQDLTIDPGASGDSFLQFSINGTGEYRVGVDDDDSDKFKISQGSALGTNDTFVMTSAGERTMPLQPAFSAYLATDDTDVTGDGTVYTLGGATALTEVFDQGSDFNTNGTFTSPITGRYQLAFGIKIFDLTTSHTTGKMQIVTSNRTYESNVFNFGAIKGGNDQTGMSMSVFADMDASDTATCTITISNGTKVVDIDGHASATCFFHGFLVC